MAETAAIEAEELTKRFGAVQALAGLDLYLSRGSILGLLGPNGAGKTTAVRVLATLLHPDSGHARAAAPGPAARAGVRAPAGPWPCPPPAAPGPPHPPSPVPRRSAPASP